MPKFVVLQGEENHEKLNELCVLHNACWVCIYDLMENNKQYGPERCISFAMGVVASLGYSKYNIVLHHRFETVKSVAAFVRLADACGYDIEFVRLESATGELLTWEEAFAC